MSDKRYSILLIDDQPSLVEALQIGLSTIESCDIAATTEVTEGLQLLETTLIDLLILDYHMPQMNGLALAKIAWQKQPDIVVILLSAENLEDIGEEEIVDKAHLLQKPASLKQIRALIKELLKISE